MSYVNFFGIPVTKFGTMWEEWLQRSYTLIFAKMATWALRAYNRQSTRRSSGTPAELNKQDEACVEYADYILGSKAMNTKSY